MENLSRCYETRELTEECVRGRTFRNIWELCRILVERRLLRHILILIASTYIAEMENKPHAMSGALLHSLLEWEWTLPAHTRRIILAFKSQVRSFYFPCRTRRAGGLANRMSTAYVPLACRAEQSMPTYVVLNFTIELGWGWVFSDRVGLYRAGK
jgi:hypothetical protein